MNEPKTFSAKEASNYAQQILHAVQSVVVGKDMIILKVLLAMLAKGHVLLEDMPGVGKTTLALAFAKTMDLDYHRIQFTPDVLPSDVTGFSVYQKDTGKMEFQKGAAFCNLLLADEINRTSPKTQSALLQLMEETAVTVDGKTYSLPAPYCVLATQNPTGSVGTQMLPESQLDRFMLRLHMGYPDLESEVQIMQARSTENPLERLEPVLTRAELQILQETAAQVYVDGAILRYIAEISAATRNHPLIKLGVSPRGSLALCAAARATALVRGRDYVTPDDIRVIVVETFAHRMLLNARAKTENITAEQLIEEIMGSVAVPKLRRYQE
ncbi:MAG: MoxR family ATPase [Oscillospiraceae bacterium]|nr:MoxR family ATPase [Oscillospiraceae bacterium]MCR4758896.1 MoxR family ATPase [Oscillospiraceae bacterium]